VISGATIDYKMIRRQQNVHNIGIDERIGVDYGSVTVTGSLKVRSTYPKFDTVLITHSNPKPFQLTLESKISLQETKVLTFDECFLEGKTFSMDSNGIALSDYQFTANRAREQ
jgi:hypothetical protein